SLTGTTGIVLDHATNLTSTGGNINLNNALTLGANQVWNGGTGTIAFGGTVNGAYNFTASAGTITSNGAWGATTALGDVTLTSTSSISLPTITTAAGKTVSATVTGAGNSITASTIATGTNGNITLTADDLVLNGNLSGTGVLTLQPYATARVVNINFGSDNGTNFHLSSTDISRFTNGWPMINIGRSDSTALMDINGNITFVDPITFYAQSKRLWGNISGTGNASFFFAAGSGNVEFTSNANLTTAGESIYFASQVRTGTTSGTVNSNGGNITFSDNLLMNAATYNLDVITGGGALTLNKITYGGNPGVKTLTLNAGSGLISFGDTVNTDANIIASAGTMTFNGAWGGTTPLGTVSLTSASSVSLPSITASSVFVRTTGATGDITIGSGSDLITSGSGGITLVAGRDFINQSGSNALQVSGGGRWVVYSTDVTGTTGEQDLTSGFNRYSCTYSGGCASGVSIPTSGNGFVYSYTPTLTVTPTVANVAYGSSVSGLKGYAYSVSGYIGSDMSADSLTGSLSGTTDYVVGNDVGTYALDYASGNLASALGYGFTYADKSNGVNVTARVLTAALTGTVTKVYDGDNTAALVLGNYTLSNVYNGDDVALGNLTSGTYNDKNAGTGKDVTVTGLFLGGSKAGNYTLASGTVVGAIGTITPKGLTVTTDAGQHKTYGATGSPLTYTYTGLASGDGSASFSGALARAAGENAGTYAINQGTLDATGNYRVTSFVGDDYTIDKAAINITAPNGSRYYGYDNPNYDWSNATITGLVNGENGSVLDNLTFGFAGSATANANAGTTHAISLGGFSDNNYTLNSFTAGTLTIAKAPLTISADSQTRLLIMPQQPLTASYSGLRNGETNSVVSGLVLHTNAISGSPIGSYTITASGATATNYAITYTNGVVVITPAALPTTIQTAQIVEGENLKTTSFENKTVATDDYTAMELSLPAVPWETTDHIRLHSNNPLVTFTPDLKNLLGMNNSDI
ncbi:MAG TPA: MBG domain-containing protein, partial [Alphaproteobacteria bacterium]